MHCATFYFKRDLPPPAPFLMLSMADADCANDDQAKAPVMTAARLKDDSREQTGGRSAVRPGWWWGVATAAVIRSAGASYSCFVAHGATRRMIPSHKRTASLDRIGEMNLALGSASSLLHKTRQNGRCRRWIPSRWGDMKQGCDCRQDADGRPSNPGNRVRSLHGEEKS